MRQLAQSLETVRLIRAPQVAEYESKINAAILKIHEHQRRRMFLLGFSQSPVDFIHALMASQV